ncbi:protein TIC 21, chloroplastic-like [Phragmites australis]|uniref:protein TIC 21, chloroplastic-like n=1 Tax=Phragmites australis TaxID=29695 RepID=UPI002D7697B4|nr:protein TIC 21, chloroplastic-like [Phragmites australis]
MQALLLPARPAPPAPAPALAMLLRRALPAYASQLSRPFLGAAARLGCGGARRGLTVAVAAAAAPSSSSGPLYPTPPPTAQEVERVKLEQVMKRLEKTARYFKNLGTLGFWSQLVCTIVSAGILSFSTVVTGKVTAPITFYSTAAGIAAAFISVFWSFGYIRLSERLRRTTKEPAKAPPRADVVKSLKNGILLNILGMGAAVLGMQATVGALVAKALTTSAVPYYQAASPGQSPVLALDVFLVQASANTILSHFLGLASSLELLRSVSLPPAEPAPAPARA